MRLELLPGAVADARQAFNWYRERDEAAAVGFFAELESALLAIDDAPDRWPTWLHRTHRYVMRRYPYFVIYRVQDTAVWVVAIAHARRSPAPAATKLGLRRDHRAAQAMNWLCCYGEENNDGSWDDVPTDT